MKRTVLSIIALTSFAAALLAAPTPPSTPQKSSAKNEKSSSTTAPSAELTRSANGWAFVQNEWVHPEGYKYVNGKVLRTTARAGHPFPKPPGKLALENPQKLSQPSMPVVNNTKPAPDKATEKARNLAPRPAPQTGSNIY